MQQAAPLNLSISERRILDVVRRHAQIPRADIAPITGQTPGAISRLVRELIELGLLYELDRISGMRGQPALPLGINSQGGVSIGISLPYGRLDVVALSYAGECIAVNKAPFEGKTIDSLLAALEIQVRGILEHPDVCHLRFVGIGLAIPGHLHTECSNDFYVPATLDWLDVNLLATWLAKTFKAPVFVENIANAAAIAEVYANEGAKLNDLVAVNLGHGIGCGLVFSGRVHRGAGGLAGEIGSLFPPFQPRPSVHDLVTIMRSAGVVVSTVDDLESFVVEGNQLLESWVERAAQQLYPLLRTLHLVTAAQKIVLTGMLPNNISESLAVRLARQIEKDIEGTLLPHSVIVPSQLATLSSAVGGAWLPIEGEGLVGRNRAKWNVD